MFVNEVKGLEKADRTLFSLPELSRMFWEWYALHQAETVVSLRVLKLVPVTLRVRDLRPLFVRLFGEAPR